MFSHVMLGADDMQASIKFYNAILGVLGTAPAIFEPKGRALYKAGDGVLLLTKPIDGPPASCANGGTVGSAAKSEAEVDAWHSARLADGGTTCEDPPGIRETAACISPISEIHPATNCASFTTPGAELNAGRCFLVRKSVNGSMRRNDVHRSTHVAIPILPPVQSVAEPFCAPRLFIC